MIEQHAEEAAEVAEQTERRLDGRERSALECSLQAWGEWWEGNAINGYPKQDAVAAHLTGVGGGYPGHRVLWNGMPKRVHDMDLRVLTLPDHERLVVWAQYVPVCKEDGRVWTAEEKARLLGISWGAYRTRLTRARFRILGLTPPV